MKRLVAAALSGVVFSLGLGLGGMTQPEKIVGFLDVAGSWDPSLMFVMAGALAAYGITRPFILKRGRPVLAPSFPPTPRGKPDRRLLTGAALFGIGWGLAGFCPGPAFTSLASAENGTVVLFVASMMAGMGLFAGLQRRSSKQAAVGSVEDTSPLGAGAPAGDV